MRNYQVDSEMSITGRLDDGTMGRLRSDLKDLAAPSEPPPGLVRWDDLEDRYGVKSRKLVNAASMRAYSDGYVLRSTSGEPMAVAPGTYGGMTISGLGGKTPKANPLLGDISDGEPDPRFYSVLGVGTTVVLPDGWIKVFGRSVKGGIMTIHPNGVEFSGELR